MMIHVLANAVLLGLVTLSPPAGAGVSAPACSSVAGVPRRLELADGRVVSVDFRSFARSGSALIALGRHANVFPRDAGPRTSPLLTDSVIGVELDGLGRLSLVGNPGLPSQAFHPRVAAIPGDDRGYHVLWATGLDRIGELPEPDDSISLWYATYRRGAWSTPMLVTTIRGARLNPELGSPLLEQNGELAVAFTFVRRRRSYPEGGVILLRQRSGRWSADTLHTRGVPAMVRAIHAPRGVAALLALANPEDPRAREKLYFATFDSGWSRPVILAGDNVRSVTLPEIIVRGSGYVASWIAWDVLNAASSELHWAILDADGTSVSSGEVGRGAATYPYALAMVADQFPLWLYRGVPGGATVALSVLTDSGIVRLPHLAAPFRNPVAATVALSNARFLVFTQKLGLMDDEPMAASFVTEVEIRCPRSRRR